MKKARFLSILFVVVLLAVAVIVEAQQPTKIPAIGVIRTGSPPDIFVEMFRQALHDLGYVEGQNLVIQ